MAQDTLKDTKALVGEFLHMLGQLVPGPRVVDEKPSQKGDTILFIDAPGYPRGGTISLNDIVDVSVTGSLYQEAAIYAANMTGKTLEELGASEVFDNAMLKIEKVWERGKETGHSESMQPTEKKELPDEFQGEIALNDGDTTKSERLDGTSDLTSPLGLGRENAAGNTEEHAGTVEAKPRRKRGRPKGSYGKKRASQRAPCEPDTSSD